MELIRLHGLLSMNKRLQKDKWISFLTSEKFVVREVTQNALSFPDKNMRIRLVNYPRFILLGVVIAELGAEVGIMSRT